MKDKDGEALVQRLARDLAAALPAELAEVLMPALTLRAGHGRLVAVLPNPAWRDTFLDHAGEPARRIAQGAGLTLHTVCRLEVAAAIGIGDRRFNAFLHDPGNQLALAACQRAVEAPGLEHNPLYVHGPRGCGKSHLLSAVAAEFRSALGEEGVIAFTGPEFVARDAQLLAERGQTPLRTRIERAALIVFDGIDALAGRQLAQEELFHLINSSLERGAQMVFAGAHAPRALSGIEERLATRLSWGLAVAMEVPHSETRLALLRRLAGAAADGIGADELARLVDTFAPDMHQVARLAERLAEGQRPGAEGDVASFDRILQTVATRYRLRPGDITGARRHRAVARARQLALLLGRRLTGHSLEALGGMVGGRDHSTVLYGIRQAEERLNADPAMAKEMGELTRLILGAD